MNNTHDIIDDRIDVTTRGLLGLTVTCSRCHDHKYDPISMRDYYGLYGVFRGCFEPTVPPLFEPPPSTDEYAKYAAEMARRENNLVEFVKHKHGELVAGARTQAADYLWSAYQLRDQPPTDDFMLLVDKGDLNPTMILRWQLYLATKQHRPDPVWSLWQVMTGLPPESFADRAKQLLATLAALPAPLTAVNPRVLAAFQQRPPATLREAAERYGELLKAIDAQWQAELQAQPGADPPRALPEPADEELRQVLYGTDSPPDVPLAMDWGFLSLFPDRPTQEEYKKLLKEVEEWMMKGSGAPPRAMVLLDDERSYQPRLFLRGNPHRPGEEVPRRFLSVLDATGRPFEHGSGRLELARAIANPDNPLTARVFVNRVWMHHFGQGLVRTPSDFGMRSDPPTHPELLDWLAAEFVHHGWSVKWLHRQILSSSVYRQASVGGTALAASLSPPAADSGLLAEFPRRRLEFEALRDAMLVAADSLDLKLGGPAVQILSGEVVPRRTIYGELDRMDVPPLLTTFDFPDPLTSSPQRSLTTVSPQALFFMNSRFAVEIARRLASRDDVRSLWDPRRRAERIFSICLSRPPTPAELSDMLMYVGPAQEDDWQRLAHGLLLCNEFLFVD